MTRSLTTRLMALYCAGSFDSLWRGASRSSDNTLKGISMNWKTLSHISCLLIAVCFSSIASADARWIDVRSTLEHSIDSIEGDVCISHGDIVKGLSELFPDKSTEIHLYCRSGGRAGKAMSALLDAGYTNVSNAGSIDNARKERGLSE